MCPVVGSTLGVTGNQGGERVSREGCANHMAFEQRPASHLRERKELC